MIGGKLRVSCFGKLPIFSDFIEPVHRTRARDDLRQWLAAGAGRPSSGADGSGLPRRAYRVVWPVRGGKEIIIALIWSSSDAVGRSFPFALYTQARPRRLGIASAADLPFAAEPVWSRLEEIASTEEGVPWVDLSTGTIAPRSVQETLAHARIVPERSLSPRSLRAARLLAADASQAFECLGPAANRQSFARVLVRLAGVVSAITRGGTAAIRLPRNEPMNALLHATFWLELVSGIARKKSPLPVLFVPLGRADDARAWLFYRDPLPVDIPVLFGLQSGHAWMDDLGAPESGADPALRPPGKLLEAIDLALVSARTLEDVIASSASVIRGEEACGTAR